MSAALYAHQGETDEALKQLEVLLQYIDDVSDSRFLFSRYFDSLADVSRFTTIRDQLAEVTKEKRKYRKPPASRITDALLRDRERRKKSSQRGEYDEEEVYE